MTGVASTPGSGNSGSKKPVQTKLRPQSDTALGFRARGREDVTDADHTSSAARLTQGHGKVAHAV